MVTEIELKYSLLENHELVTSEQIKTKVSQLLSEHELTFIHNEKQLSNHYFDTPDLTLRKGKVALRTRGTKCLGEDEHFEQTVKTSGTIIAGLHQRPEYNVDIDDEKPIIALFPHTIWQPKTNISQLQQQIVELFSTHFTRHTWLVNVDNSQVEIAFDCGEIACQNYVNKPRIYEIELELVSGDTQALFVLTKLLFSQLALRPGQLTKAARGYALYHESKTPGSEVDSKVANEAVIVDQISLSMLDRPKNMQLDNAFTHGIESSLTQLQLSVDSYVEASSVDRLNKLNKVSELLVLLRQGFWLFNEILTTDEIALRAELSYFIRTISWVDNARYIQLLTRKQSTYQKETSVNQELITKLQLTQARYPSESQVLALLHSERFNNLQVNLLALLLTRHSDNTSTIRNHSSLVDFAINHLNTSTKSLSSELERLIEPQCSLSIERYLTAHSLLIRALATTSWFSCLFTEPQNELIKRYNMPWLDVKQGISELQSLSL
jgi:triphosphatase